MVLQVAVRNRARGSRYGGGRRAAPHSRRNENERGASRRLTQDRAHWSALPSAGLTPTGRAGLATHSPSDLGDRVSPCPRRTLPAWVGGGRSDHRVPCHRRLPVVQPDSAPLPPRLWPPNGG